MRSVLLPLLPVLILAGAVLAATTMAAWRSGDDLLSGPGGLAAQRVGRQAGRWARALRRRARPGAGTKPADRGEAPAQH